MLYFNPPLLPLLPLFTGEGTLLTIEERKSLAETWRVVCSKYDILMMVMVSGCNFKGVEELTKHAESIGANAILVLPELYYRPKTVEMLVEYVKDVSTFCPNTPVYYYHYPARTNVTRKDVIEYKILFPNNINYFSIFLIFLSVFMPDFMKEAKKKISNFHGIKFTSSDLREGAQCLKHGQVFLGAAPVILGALALGFDSGIMTVLNIFPEYIFQIRDNLFNGNLKDAQVLQGMMNGEIQDILKISESPRGILNIHINSHVLLPEDGVWAASMKAEFNKRNPNIQLGDTRKPLT